MEGVFANYSSGKTEETQEPLELKGVSLSTVLNSTVVRSVIQLTSEREVADKVNQFATGLQTQEMYRVSSNPVAKTVTLEYKCSGWPSKFVLEQLSKLGSLYIKVTYMPHFSQVNKVIAEEMGKLKLDYRPIWYDVRIRAMESSNIIELTQAEQPAATGEGKFELKWSERKPNCQGTLSNGSIFLDSRLRPIAVVELTKERIVFDQVESVTSVVDAIFHLSDLNGDTYGDSNITFDIDPRNFKWVDIPLEFMFHYDIQMRLHSPTTLRVFFVRQELKHDKELASLAGRKTV